MGKKTFWLERIVMAMVSGILVATAPPVFAEEWKTGDVPNSTLVEQIGDYVASWDGKRLQTPP